ncbi:MAG: FAD/NAD(P)-binding protein [Rhodomicrobiaceae bacterium]
MARPNNTEPTGSRGRDPMTPVPARILDVRPDLADVVTLTIGIDEAALPEFTPGQFNMLAVFGVGEIPVSISGPPADQRRLIHTIRAVGPVSAALTRLTTGDWLGLRGPFGVGWPVADAAGQDVVLVAGGLGLAPLRPAIYALQAERDRYGKIAVMYGARNPAQILFRDEFDEWRRHGIEVAVTVDIADTDWHGDVGVVPKLIARASFDPMNCIAMVCGPEIMMRYSIMALRDAGVAPDAVYLSMERNMKCAIGHCGHCQLGPVFVCKDGPVFRHDRISHLLTVGEL